MLSPVPRPNVCQVNGGFGGARILVREMGAHGHADDFILHGDSWRLTQSGSPSWGDRQKQLSGVDALEWSFKGCVRASREKRGGKGSLKWTATSGGAGRSSAHGTVSSLKPGLTTLGLGSLF